MTCFIDFGLTFGVKILDPHILSWAQIGQEREKATQVCASKTIWPSSPLQKSLIWGKLAGEERRGGSLVFEVQIPVEMDLICTYDMSLQQDGIMPEIWTPIWTICFCFCFFCTKQWFCLLLLISEKYIASFQPLCVWGEGHRVVKYWIEDTFYLPKNGKKWTLPRTFYFTEICKKSKSPVFIHYELSQIWQIYLCKFLEGWIKRCGKIR